MTEAVSTEWLFLPVNAEQRRILADELRIPFLDMAVSRPEPAEGVAFPPDQLAPVLERLRLRPIRTAQTNIQRVRIQRTAPIAPRPPRTVSYQTGSLEQRPRMEPLIQAFANAIDHDVIVRNEAGIAAAWTEDEGTFFIHFWSAPIRSGHKPWDITIYGHALRGGQRDGMELSDYGTPIVDNNGHIVAQTEGCHLWIPFDMPHSPGTAIELMLEPLLEEVQRIFRGHGTDPEILRQRQLENSRREYVALCTERNKRMEKSLRDRMDRLNESIEIYSRNVIDYIRELADVQHQMIGFDPNNQPSEADILREFDTILNMPEVESVFVDSTGVTVNTKHLNTIVLSNGNSYSLGSYRIFIGTNGVIRVHRREGDFRGMHHPHETGGGSMCLGNTGPGITQLIAEYQFAIAAQMLITFLQEPNLDDATGRRVLHFPLAVADDASARTEGYEHLDGVMENYDPDDDYIESDDDDDWDDEDSEEEDWDDEEFSDDDEE